MFRIGFIDYFLDEWHANNYPKWIADNSKGEMAVTHAYASIDSPLGGRTTEQWCKDFGVTRCHTIDELIAACDGIVVLSPDNPEQHIPLCEKPLRSGKPVFIDKTFAASLADAKAIFDYARESGTPCYSTSALRYASEYEGIDRAGIRSLSSWGGGRFAGYSVHQLDPIVMLMGVPGKRVIALKGEDCVNLLMEFADGRTVQMCCFYGDTPFAMCFAMKDHSNPAVTIQSEFFQAFIRKLIDFFHDPRPLVEHAETLEVMAIADAGNRALANPGVWVDVPRP